MSARESPSRTFLTSHGQCPSRDPPARGKLCAELLSLNAKAATESATAGEPIAAPKDATLAAEGAGSDASAAPPCQEAESTQRSFQKVFTVSFLSFFAAAVKSNVSIFAMILARKSDDTAGYLPSLLRLWNFGLLQ